MAALMLWRQRQLNRAPDRPVGAQHRLGQLEQRVRSRGQVPLELPPEPGQLAARTNMRDVTHSDHHSLNHDHLFGQEA
jgi:hypothetical protein